MVETKRWRKRNGYRLAGNKVYKRINLKKEWHCFCHSFYFRTCCLLKFLFFAFVSLRISNPASPFRQFATGQIRNFGEIFDLGATILPENRPFKWRGIAWQRSRRGKQKKFYSLMLHLPKKFNHTKVGEEFFAICGCICRKNSAIPKRGGNLCVSTAKRFNHTKVMGKAYQT